MGRLWIPVRAGIRPPIINRIYQRKESSQAMFRGCQPAASWKT